MQLEKLLSALSGAQVNISISVSPSTANTKSEETGLKHTNKINERWLYKCLDDYCDQHDCDECPVYDAMFLCPLERLKDALNHVLDKPHDEDQ